MKIASVAQIKNQFSAFVKASGAGPVVVTKNGKPVAVLVGVEDEEEIERLLMAYSPRLRRVLERSRKQFERGETLTHQAFWAEVARPRKSGKHAPRA